MGRLILQNLIESPKQQRGGQKWSILSKPKFYFYSTVAVVVLYVTLMTYVIPKHWFDTAAAKDFVNCMAEIVPMLAHLQTLPVYSNYWGAFYAIFWFISPVIPIFGVLAVMCRSIEDMQKIEPERLLRIRDFPYKILVKAMIFLPLVFIFTFTIPETGRVFWFNETSSYFFLLLATCLQIALSPFCMGVFVGVFRLKYLLNK